MALKEFIIRSQKLRMDVRLRGKEYVDRYGNTFLNVDDASLRKALELANAIRGTQVSDELLAQNESHPVFRCRITDRTGGLGVVVIGEADRSGSLRFWHDKRYTLAYKRRVNQAAIQYLNLEYPGRVYSFAENVQGIALEQYLAEQELKAQQIPAANQPFTEILDELSGLREKGITNVASVPEEMEKEQKPKTVPDIRRDRTQNNEEALPSLEDIAMAGAGLIKDGKSREEIVLKDSGTPEDNYAKSSHNRYLQPDLSGMAGIPGVSAAVRQMQEALCRT